MQRKMCWGSFSQSFLQDCCKTFLLYILTLWVKPFKFQELSSNFIINVFLKNFKCKFMFLEAYLEPSQTSTMELFWENSWWLVANKYFCTNATSYGSKYASGSLDKLCKIRPLNSFILQHHYVITSLSFVFENENITLKNIW